MTPERRGFVVPGWSPSGPLAGCEAPGVGGELLAAGDRAEPPDSTVELQVRVVVLRDGHAADRAAQHGLAAELTWPFGDNGRLRTLPAAKLVAEVLPPAREGLIGVDVAAQEADHLLAVIAARVSSGQTGAVWQRRTLATLEPQLGREHARAAMLERYLQYAATNQPVHTWSTNP